jgi:hypothetical protein
VDSQHRGDGCRVCVGPRHGRGLDVGARRSGVERRREGAAARPLSLHGRGTRAGTAAPARRLARAATGPSRHEHDGADAADVAHGRHAADSRSSGLRRRWRTPDDRRGDATDDGGPRPRSASRSHDRRASGRRGATGDGCSSAASRRGRDPGGARRAGRTIGDLARRGDATTSDDATAPAGSTRPARSGGGTGSGTITRRRRPGTGRARARPEWTR